MRGARDGEDDDLVVIEVDDEPAPAPGPPPGLTTARASRRTRIVAIAAVGVVVVVAAFATIRVRDRAHHALLPFATGTALVTANGARLHRVDVDTGVERSARYDVFRPPATTLMLATRDAVVVALASPQNSPVLSTYLVSADLHGVPMPIATSADQVVVSADGRRLIVGKDRSNLLVEVDGRGHLVVEPGGEASYGTPIAALPGGIVTEGWTFQTTTGDTTVVREGRVVATGGTRVAWMRACDAARCPLLVTDVRTGRERSFAEPALAPLLSPYFVTGIADVSMGGELLGRVSPDGRHLVVVGPDRSVVLVDLDTGAARRVRTTASDLHAVAWSPDGRTLFALDAASHRPRLVAIVPETGATHTLDVPVAPGTSSLLAVPGPRHGARRAVAAAPTTTTTAPPNRPVLGARTGLDLVAVGAETLDTVHLDTGATTRVALPAPVSNYEGDDSFAPVPDQPGRRPIAVGDRVVFLRDAHAYSAGPGRIVELGAAVEIFPSVDREHVWIVPSLSDDATPGVPVREVDVTDARVARTITVPEQPVAAAGDGLLLRADVPGSDTGRLLLASPGGATRVVVAGLTSTTSVLAAGPNAVVLGDQACTCLHVVDVATATARDVPSFARGASFAPDGRTLAIAGGRDATWTLLDVDTLALRSIPSLGAADSTPVWSPDGRWLFGWSYTAVTAYSTVDGRTADVPGAGGATRFAVLDR
ncbi:MAG TPA: hypothetical protein VFW74_17930 [Acidimicrobiia bacterium]|nr:hypothetical protein [Acidimicrobiia bacterium]